MTDKDRIDIALWIRQTSQLNSRMISLESRLESLADELQRYMVRTEGINNSADRRITDLDARIKRLYHRLRKRIDNVAEEMGIKTRYKIKN